MAKLPTQYFFLVSLIFLSFSVASSEDDFDYGMNSTNGPAHWGDIKPEWHLCKDGRAQSPLETHDRPVQADLGPLDINYHPSNASLFSTGHEIRLEWTSGAGYLLINETKYILQHCQWHFPSEHSINDEGSDFEIQLVHKSEAGRVAIIGVLYQEDKISAPDPSDPFLATIMDALTHISEKREAKIPLGVVDPERVINIKGRGYYRYIGSLTTPPCDENVVWTVIAGEDKPSVAHQQIRMINAAVQDRWYLNARPPQPLNSRLVQFQNK